MHVIIVGAGPSGLLLSLLLARGGVKSTLLEAGDSVDERPRAAHYGPPAIAVLRRAGVLDDVRAQGLIPGNVFWRKLDHSVIAEMKDSSQLNNPDSMTVLPLGDLGKVLVKHAKTYDNITINFGHSVSSIGQNDDSAYASGKRSDGSEFRVEGDYLCGTDGGQSTVRKSLFGRNFDGFSWDRQIIATNVYLPDLPTLGDSNFIIHPEHHLMVAKITRDGLWRASYGESADLTFEEVLERQPDKFRTMLRLEPHEYKIASCYPYRIHQRCAPKFRVGRICLAADAAHIVNPHGGMGLTGGIADVEGLADCLMGIADGKASPDILDKYDEVRRKIWYDIINPVSTENMKRISSDAEVASEKDPLMQMVRKSWHDDQLHKQMQAFAYAISHDFTQYYDTAPAQSTEESKK